MKPLLLTLGLALLLPSSAAAQTVAPPPAPVLVSPKAGAEIDKPKTITFRVRAQPNEADGSLGIELANDGPVGRERDGSYEDDGPYTLGRWELKPTEAGSDLYEVTVSSKLFASPYDPSGPEGAETYVYWHAFRTLPAESCTTIQGDEGPEQDCFQQSEGERTAHVTRVMEPGPDSGKYGKHEPNNSRRNAFDWPDSHPAALSRDIWLGNATDKDWYYFSLQSVDRFELDVRNRGKGAMSITVYRGKTVKLRRRLAGGKRLLEVVKAKPNSFGILQLDLRIRHASGSNAKRVKYFMDGNFFNS